MAVKPADVAKESVGLFKRGQRALLDRLQKMVDDGASKADLDKVAGNASKIKPGPGAIARLKAAEARAIDFIARGKRKGRMVDGKFVDNTSSKLRRGAARTIVYGGGATALGTAGNATSNSNNTSSGDAAVSATNPKGITPAEKARIMKEAAEKEKEIRAGTSKGKGKGKLFPKFRPFGGVIARALLGDDEKFGGERGMIDFIRLKKKQDKTPTETAKMKVMAAAQKKLKAAEKKAAADVAKAKQKAKGLKNGGMAKKPVKKNMGGMTKKGYANGGMAKKGYANGGPAKKTTAKKTSSRGKARGVGAATRGYGATMR